MMIWSSSTQSHWEALQHASLSTIAQAQPYFGQRVAIANHEDRAEARIVGADVQTLVHPQGQRVSGVALLSDEGFAFPVMADTHLVQKGPATDDALWMAIVTEARAHQSPFAVQDERTLMHQRLSFQSSATQRYPIIGYLVGVTRTFYAVPHSPDLVETVALHLDTGEALWTCALTPETRITQA